MNMQIYINISEQIYLYLRFFYHANRGSRVCVYNLINSLGLTVVLLLQMSTSVVYYTSPIGILAISSKEDLITSVLFTETVGQSLESSILSNAVEQLDEYFANKRNVFDLPLAPEGTDFQKRVWNELLTIPFGKTTTYLDMAKRLGDEKVIRAAASANGKNPIAIIIPCHRVIGSDGKLTGYAGGLWRKKWLLKHEGVSSQVDLFS